MKDYVLRLMSEVGKFDLLNFMMTREMVFFEVWLTITFLNMVVGTIVTGLIATSLSAQYWMVKHGKHPFFQNKVVFNLSGRTGTSSTSSTSGTSGISGISGTSGTSGTSGKSAFSNVEKKDATPTPKSEVPPFMDNSSSGVRTRSSYSGDE